MTRLILALLVAGAALAACGDGSGAPDARPASSPRAATIVAKKSIGGVRLGADAAEVQGRLGAPDSTLPSRLHGGWTEWRYRRSDLRVTLDGERRVWAVETASPVMRTDAGVGVGTPERRLRRVMAGVRCSPFGGPDRYRRLRVCVDTPNYRGPFTSFTLRDLRVRSVTVTQGLAM